MKRIHALIVAATVAFAAIAGTFAALRTTQLGSNATPHVSAAQYAQQNRALDRAELALLAQLRRKPPAIPSTGAVQAAPQTVVYRRSAPIVHVIHRHGGDHEYEAAGGAGLDD